MKLSLFNFVICIILIQVISCSKGKENDPPEIDIITPGNLESFTVPDTITVTFNISTSQPVEYIRISIDNSNLTSISKNVFLYPDTNHYSDVISIHVDIIPEKIKSPPYYVHFAVSKNSMLYHEYREIVLKNSAIEFKGLITIEDHSINQMKITRFNEYFEPMLFTWMNGSCSGSAISHETGLLYVTSTNPDLLRSYDQDTLGHIWTKNAQLPYPEFTGINVEGDIVYAAYSTGRMSGFKGYDGLQIFNTDITPDTIPHNICFTHDYIVANYTLRNSTDQGLVTFYKITGHKLHVHPFEFNTVSMYQVNSNELIIFCNSENSGYAVLFDPEQNIIRNSIHLINNAIGSVCKTDDAEYLFSTPESLYRFSFETENVYKIYDSEDIISTLKFDTITNSLYVVSPDKTDVFTYPYLNLITSIESDGSIKSIEIMYGY